MNVRLEAHSIRVRISLEEARQLASGERLFMSLALASSSPWRVELRPTASETLRGRLTSAGLELEVPLSGVARALTEHPSKRAGVYGAQAVDGAELQLAVEIDARSRPEG